MKNNLCFIKKTKRHLIAFLVLFFGLFANTISAQTIYTWTGLGGDNKWETVANWETAIGVPATNAPGNATNDNVVISNGASVLYSTTTTKTVQRINLSNLTGPSSGSTLTIDSGASLQVQGGGASQPIIIKGGTIVNNGTLEVLSSASNALTYSPFNIANPEVVPVGGPFTYGYTGGANSNLTITYNTPAGTATSAAFLINATTAFSNSKISLVFGGTNTISFTTTANQTMAIRTVATDAAPLTISGTGFTTNTALIAANPGSDITVEAGTTLTSTVSGFLTNAMFFTSSATASTTFTNKGTLNIGGSYTGKHGIQLTSPNNAIGKKIIFENQGTINVNIATSTNATAPLGILNSGTTARGEVKITNTASGIMNLKNTFATGPAFSVTANLGSPNIDFINDGSLNLSGNNFNSLGQAVATKITNNGLITSNNEIRNLTLLNNSGKTISFVKDALSLNARFALSNFTTFTTNNGIIQTATGTLQLNNLASVAGLSSSSVIEPGGSTGKGWAIFSSASYTISGTLKLQVDGTVAGTSYDQILNTLATGSFTLSGATLDVTGIYTPSSDVTIDIVIASTVAGSQGTITGTFDSVIGLTSGWSINYIAGSAGVTTGKVQLVYTATSPTATTWTGGTSIDWTDATNWSAGVPDQNSNVTIGTGTFQPTIATNVNINSLTINSTASLTVNSSVTGVNLTVTGAIANSGTMTLANNVNLIQGGTTNTNTGNVIVNRNSNALSRLDYTLWSSPVAGQDLFDFSPLTFTSPSRFYTYNETTNFYNAITTPSGTSFSAGSGYLIRIPDNHPATPTVWNGSFSGVPNNGNIAKAVTILGTGYNAVGNPYPSTIDAQAFIAANTANIESSLYFWRKINAASGSAYAVYNPLGSTKATPSSDLPNGTIQVGQGFFVKAKSGATSVSFTNAMRVANNANQFFRTKAVQKDRLWLNLSRPASKIGTIDIPEVFSQALIGYTADATSGVDMYDAKYINDSETALSSSINSEEYSIQGRPAFDATDVVALNFKNDADVTYTIALDQFDGVFATGQDVYLLDSKTGIETDLKAGSYTFTATAGVDNARFSLKYQKTLGVNAPAFNDNSVSVYKNNGTLYVNSGSVAINTIEVYDVLGRLLASQRNVKATTATISNLRAINQVLIVTISDENNSVVSKKVMN